MPEPDITFRLEGVDQMVRKMKDLLRDHGKRVEQALFVEANEIMTRSKRDRVPVARSGGSLRNSGHVTPPERKGDVIEVAMIFGGTSAPYALAVHEHPSKHSPPSWRGKGIAEINWNVPGTGPKYLELEMRASQKGMEQRLAQRLKL